MTATELVPIFFLFFFLIFFSYFFFLGEVACTGLHGANRLASTSLLEGLVWGCSIADHLADSSMPDSRNGLAASADLHGVLPPNIPGDGVPLVHREAVDSAWKNIRCACEAFALKPHQVKSRILLTGFCIRSNTSIHTFSFVRVQ